MRKDKWLITIDLDGTFLKTGKMGESNYGVNPKNIKVVKKLINQGHKVAIVTGRPWRESKLVYEKIGLNSIIANYNGAHIHYPNNKSFVDLTFSMNKEILFKVFDEKVLKKFGIGFIVETMEKSYIKGDISKKKMIMMGVEEEKVNIQNWKSKKDINLNPQSAFVNIDFNNIDPFEILQILKRNYGSSMFFRLWDGRTEEEPFVILEINQIASNKGTAMEYIAAYYNIPKSNTIAFGDGLNDREMLLQASIGVAMKNSKGTVKTYADDTTDFTNDDAGVGKYLEKFFDIK